MEREVRYFNLTKEELFSRLEDYFLMKRLKIIESYEPDCMSIKLGSWISISLGKSKANTFLKIMEKDRRSHMIVVFDFINEYIASFFFPFIFWIVVGVLIGLSNPKSFFESIYICFIPGILSGFIGLAIFKWEAPKTKSKFIYC